MTRRTPVAALTLASLLVASAAASQDRRAPPNAAEAARAASQVAEQATDFANQVSEGAITEDADAPPADPIERARRGIVLLERNGRVLGVGTVLNGDGRILTALSQLGHGNDVDARFADGSVTQVRMGHTDRGWDLALLVPKTGRWTQGLRASKQDPTAAGTSLRTFRTLNAKTLAPSRVIVKGLRTLRGADSELLPDAVEVDSRFKQSDVGSPVVDDRGHVVAMIARACDPTKAEGCARVPYGVPVSAIKAFLRTVPRSAVPPAPWLGIQGVAHEAGPVQGVRVIGVHPESPAGAAGIRGGRDDADVVVAVDNVPVTTPEALSEAINKRAVGDTIQVLLYGSGRFRQVSVSLRAAPGQTPRKAAAAPAPRQRSVRPARPRPKRAPRPRPR